MTLSSEGQTYRLTRGGGAPTGQASAAPTTQAPMPNGTNGNANAGGMGVAGATGQDAQIAQLLASSAWCSMKYSGGSTYTGGSYGRTSTERVVFGAQGQGVRTTGSENTNSGAPGSAYMGSQGGERFLWKVQGGQLQLSSDGAQWGATPLQIYDNGSGSPIVKANGTEYNLCR
jgi:hypothetical protein